MVVPYRSFESPPRARHSIVPWKSRFAHSYVLLICKTPARTSAPCYDVLEKEFCSQNETQPLLRDVTILEKEAERVMRKKTEEVEERLMYPFCTSATLHEPVVLSFGFCLAVVPFSSSARATPHKKGTRELLDTDMDPVCVDFSGRKHSVMQHFTLHFAIFSQAATSQVTDSVLEEYTECEMKNQKEDNTARSFIPLYRPT